MKNNTKGQEILDAYASLIVTQGLEGASIGAVARYMGINQSLIFHYFRNKEDLTVQLSRSVAEKCMRSYERAWPATRAVTPEAFEEYVATILEIHRRRSRKVSPKLYFALIYLMPRNKEVHRSFEELAAAAVQLISARFAQCRDAGIIRTEDCEMSARTLLCLADGILCYDGLMPAYRHEAFIEAQRRLFYASVGYTPLQK